MTAFKQVLTNLQAGQREEALIGLEFVLRLDPSFVPAKNLQTQLAASQDEIDLGDIIAQLQAPTTDAIDSLLIEAVDDFNSREFLAAKEKVEEVLIDLPGHQQARELRDQIDKALKIEGQVGQFLIQAREALAAGDPQEAANFVMMAQALDPHHTGIATTLKEIDDTGGLALAHQSPDAPAQPNPVEPSSAPPVDDAPAETGPPVSPEEPEADALDTPLEPETPVAEDDAFAVEFDAQDPFADLIDEVPDDAPQESASDFGSAPDFSPAGDGGELSFPPMDDTADLFTAPGHAVDAHSPEAAASGEWTDQQGAGGDEDDDEGSMAATIEELIENGRAALDRNDHPEAISALSRVFLLKPNHPLAGRLIIKAKQSLAEADSRVEELLTKARDAFDEGEFDAANLLISKALSTRPNHIQATMLKEELDREVAGGSEQPASDVPPASAPPPPSAEPTAPELPDLDDDLFGDPGDPGETELPADDSLDGSADDAGDDLFSEDDDFDDFGDVSLLARLKKKLPVRTLAIAAVALVVVLAGVWLGGRFLSSEPEIDQSTAVNEVLLEADRLFKERKVEEALYLLREFPAEGLFKQRIDNRIAKYEEAIAPPTPTPVPEEASQAQTLLDQGLWWSAYVSAGEGLKKHPDDAGLSEIRGLVAEIEPEAAVLENALGNGDYRMAVSITEELLLQYTEQGDLMVVLERSLFNAALAEARAYNLTGAENHLNRLLELKPGDEEAIRFIEMVQKYKVSAADMRLEIFIRSMKER
jgi:tetratricopeptide (TPR) repeat protein